MVSSSLKGSFRNYCLQHLVTLHHPLTDATESIHDADIEAACDVFESVVAAEGTPRQFSGLEDQFYSAFSAYLTLPRTELGNLCVAVDRIAGLIDPFLKNLALHLYPDRVLTKVRNDKKEKVLLWKTSNYADILEELGIISLSELRNDKDSYWSVQLARYAIVRKGFAFRHRGVHESRMLTLWEMESTAYAIVAQFLVICLHVMRDSQLTEKLRILTERTRALYLLHDRVRSFPLTQNLLSIREHGLLYQYRRDLKPDIQEKRFLFLNYLAGRGPCFFWLGQEPADLVLRWAEEIYKTTGDFNIKKASARFLLRARSRLPLESLLSLFSDYADKAELASYIARVTAVSDRGALMPLVHGKREEVALEAAKLFVRCSSRIDAVLRRLAISSSTQRIGLLRTCIRHVARPEHIPTYRASITKGNRANRVLNALCLGEVGEPSDLQTLKSLIKNKRTARGVRETFLYASGRIADRIKDRDFLRRLINGRENATFLAGVTTTTRTGLGSDLTLLLHQAAHSPKRRQAVSELLERVCVRGDRLFLRRFLRLYGLDNSTRHAILALCRVGLPEDCRFLLGLFLNCARKIELFNHVRIAEAIAGLCSSELRPYLGRYLKSHEFWRYVKPNEPRARGGLPIRNTENLPLVRRITAACFVAVATSRDRRTVLRLLRHNYGWIASKACEGIRRIGRQEDIDKLVTDLLATKDEETMTKTVGGLSALDCKLYAPAIPE